MRRETVLFRVFAALAVILSDLMCAVVAYNYAGMQCGIAHRGFSAPAETAFLLAIPYAAGIAACAVLAVVFHKRAARGR